MKRQAFDNEAYLKWQSQKIRERLEMFEDKLYLEFGGKLFDDHHAARVLPGFAPDSKVTMLAELADDAEIVIVINAFDIEKNKKRNDYGITYDVDVLRMVDEFRERGLYVGSVVISRYADQPAAAAFQQKLEALGIKVYRHYTIQGYPTDVARIVSEEGLGRNEYVETERRLIVVTAPGPGSGKMATCLSQLYHDSKRGRRSGYAKFETFPIWNLPLKHPIHLAYEAATADLADVNMIDPFHLEAYGITTVNYNRDVEIFPALKEIFTRILGESPYKSPTDMGVNQIGFCIKDDEAACIAARDEIIRRYYNALVKTRRGDDDGAEAEKIGLVMRQAGIAVEQRSVVTPALEKEAATGGPAVAIELPDGSIVTGKTSPLLGSASAALLNALKKLAGIRDSIDLMSRYIIAPIQELKTEYLGNRSALLHIDELLIALSVCAITDSNAAAALAQLPMLKDCEMHSTVILSSVDMNLLKKLGMNITCEPKYETNRLYNT